MSDDRNKAFDILILTSCIAVPPGFLAILGMFASVVSDKAWNYPSAIGIVASSTLAICYGTRRVWRTGMCAELRRGFASSYIAHIVALFVASLLLDGGLTMYACLLASILYWTTVGFVVARRPRMPTPFDMFLVSRGYLVLAFAVLLVFWTTYCARGY